MKVMRCKHCNAENREKAKYCRRCGSRFPNWEEPKPKIIYKKYTSYKVPKWMYWLSGGLIGLLIVSGLYAYGLEIHNYGGPHYISSIVGKKTYFKINGTDTVVPIIFATQDFGTTINVQSNIGYNIKDLPNWCVIRDRSKTSFQIMPYRNNGNERIDTCYIESMEYKIPIVLAQRGNCNAEIHSITKRDILYDKEPYLKFSVKFSTSNMRSNKGLCNIYFYDKNRNPIFTTNKNYSDNNGHLQIKKYFTPNYRNTTYNDFTLFLPQEVLHESDINRKVYIVISIWDVILGESYLLDWTERTLKTDRIVRFNS